MNVALAKVLVLEGKKPVLAREIVRANLILGFDAVVVVVVDENNNSADKMVYASCQSAYHKYSHANVATFALGESNILHIDDVIQALCNEKKKKIM